MTTALGLGEFKTSRTSDFKRSESWFWICSISAAQQSLQAWTLKRCADLHNLYQIGDSGTRQLTTLRIHSLELFGLGIPVLVKRLSKLNFLKVVGDECRQDSEIYLRIVDVVSHKVRDFFWKLYEKLPKIKTKLNFHIRSRVLLKMEQSFRQFGKMKFWQRTETSNRNWSLWVNIASPLCSRSIFNIWLFLKTLRSSYSRCSETYNDSEWPKASSMALVRNCWLIVNRWLN